MDPTWTTNGVLDVNEVTLGLLQKYTRMPKASFEEIMQEIDSRFAIPQKESGHFCHFIPCPICEKKRNDLPQNPLKHNPITWQDGSQSCGSDCKICYPAPQKESGDLEFVEVDKLEMVNIIKQAGTEWYQFNDPITPLAIFLTNALASAKEMWLKVKEPS